MYFHKQIGWLTIALVGGATLLIGLLWIFCGELVNAVFFIVLMLLTVLFYCLTVVADDEGLGVRFGIGVIGTKFRWKDIESCSPVRNKWYYGWGIRRLERGWMYNVSGLDAVEIYMKNGKIYRIGTDEPETLCNFIQERLTKPKS